MRTALPFTLALASTLFLGCRAAQTAEQAAERADTAAAEPVGPTTIAFGACCLQGRAQPVWDAVVAAEPDLFIFAGDNIYGDTEDMAVMQAKYDQLGAEPGYQRMLETCPVLAVYDDHDYGVNDGGREYLKRAESAEMCLDFFGVPQDDPRRDHEGIYGASMIGDPGKRVQVILLDTRYFRDPIDKSTLTAEERLAANVVGWYTPTTDTTRTLLGEEQWRWLAAELRKDAEVRLIVSSIQVVSREKGMECWGNMPHERDSMFELIDATDASGVVFLSGDVHFAEVSRSNEGPYPLHDFTSSGLAQASPSRWPTAVNSYRVPDKLFVGDNFGVIRIDWDGSDIQLRLQACTAKGEVAFEHVVGLNSLRESD